MPSAFVRTLAALALGAFLVACGVDAPTEAPTVPTPTSVPTPIPPAPVMPRPAIPFPPGAAASTTTMSFTSDTGDYIGQGLSRTYYLGDGTWNARFDTNLSGGHVAISIQNFTVPGEGWSWNLDFASPRGRQFTQGNYDAARRYPFQPDTQPGLSVSGVGRGCNTLTGSFVVDEIRIGPGNSVDRFRATWEQHCEGASPAMRGQIVIASDPWR